MTTHSYSSHGPLSVCAAAALFVIATLNAGNGRAEEASKSDPVTINLDAIEPKKPVEFSPVPRMTSTVPDDPEPVPEKRQGPATSKPQGTAAAIPRLKPAAAAIAQPTEVPARPGAAPAAAAESAVAAPAAVVLSQAPILPEEPSISEATAEKERPVAKVEDGAVKQPQADDEPSTPPAAQAAAAAELPSAAPPGTQSAQDTTALAALAAESKPSAGLSPLGEALRGNSVVARMRFADGSSELGADVRVTLDTLAERLRPLTMRMHLVALSGPKGDNSSGARRLSLIRALRVREYLIAKGIARTRVIVSAFGGAPDGNTDRVDLLIANDQVARITGQASTTAVPGN